MRHAGSNLIGTLLKIPTRLGYMEHRLMEITGLSRDFCRLVIQTERDAILEGHKTCQLAGELDFLKPDRRCWQEAKFHLEESAGRFPLPHEEG